MVVCVMSRAKHEAEILDYIFRLAIIIYSEREKKETYFSGVRKVLSYTNYLGFCIRRMIPI